MKPKQVNGFDFIALESTIVSVFEALCNANRKKTAEDIEDALQDAVLLLLEKGIDDPAQIPGFLYNSAENFLKNKQKKYAHYTNFSQTNGVEQSSQSVENTEKSIAEHDYLEFLLNHLTPKSQKIVLENDDGKTLAEIAQELGKSHVSVKKTHERAMKKMREIGELEQEREREREREDF